MTNALVARWRRLTPEQRLAIGVGVPAVGAAALWSRFRGAGGKDAETMAAEGEVADESTASMLGYSVGTGADAGSLGSITEAWNDALAALTGQIEDVGETATGAASAAAEAQAAAEAAQAAAEAAQAAADEGGDIPSDGTGTGAGTTTGTRRCQGGRYGFGFQYDLLKNQITLLTRQIVRMRARLATMAPGPNRRRLRAQIQQTVARKRAVQVRARAWRQACRAARTGGGPTDLTAAAYAPGLVVVGPSMGAGGSTLSSPVGSPAYLPAAARRSGLLPRRR